MTSPPPPQPEQIAEMLRELASKVDRLDARLAALESFPRHTSASEAEFEQPPSDDNDPLPPDPAEQVSHEFNDPPTPPPLDPAEAESSVWDTRYIHTPPTLPIPAEAAPARASRGHQARFDRTNFEWILGAKGLALIGMLIVVVGVGMFLKYAYDEGWMASISPIARCASAAGFGALLLAGGEIVRRRINPLASSGISATGIAVVYASILTASRLYELLDTTTTFILLATITTLGVLLGSLSNRVMLAMLSLVGAFLVPFMLASASPSHTAMPAYLLSLLTLGLVLAGWRGGGYARVRRLAWWGTSIIGTLWISSVYNSAPINALVFAGLVWIATVVELVVSARFFKTLRDRTPWPDRSTAGFRRDHTGEIRFTPASLLSPEARWLNSAFGVTAWAAIVGSVTLSTTNPSLNWLVPTALAIASLVIVTITLRLFRSPAVHLWASDPSPRSALAAALTLNASLLVVAAVAMALGGWAQVATWGAIGLAAIETSRRLRFRAAGVFGLALLGVAASRLFVIDFASHLSSDSVATPLGLAVSPWSGQMLYIAAAVSIASWRCRHTNEQHVSATASLWLLAATLLHTAASPDALGPVWLGLAACTGWITTRVHIQSLRYSAYSLAGLGMGITLFGQAALTKASPSDISLDLNPIPMCFALLSWLAFAAIPRLGFQARTSSAALAILSGGIALASLHDSLGIPETLLVGVGYAGLLLLVGRRLYRWSIAELASVVLLVLTAIWVIDRVNTGRAALEGLPVANIAFAVAMATAALWLWLGRSMHTLPEADDAPEEFISLRQHIGAAAMGIAWLLLLACTSIDVLRGVGTVLDQRSAQGAALSIWWSLFAVASVALGFRLSVSLRWVGLGLLGIVATKVLLLDTQTLSPPARIVAAISVGLVIIGAGVLYARLMRHTERIDSADAPDDRD